MKNFSLILTIPFLLATLTATFSQTAEKTLVKGFNLMGNQTVFLDLNGNVEVQQWNQDQLRIQMTIKLENSTDMVLKGLVQAGRYNLVSSDANGEYKVTAPGFDKPVKMKSGQDIGESVSFIVYAPANVTVRLREAEATGSVEETKKASF